MGKGADVLVKSMLGFDPKEAIESIKPMVAQGQQFFGSLDQKLALILTKLDDAASERAEILALLKARQNDVAQDQSDGTGQGQRGQGQA